MGRPGSKLRGPTREGIIRDLLLRQQAGDLGDCHPDIFGGNVLTQVEIAEKWQVSAATVNKMASDLETRQRAELDPYDFT